MPRPDHCLRLRHGARARDGSAERHGEGLSTRDRFGEPRASGAFRRRDDGRLDRRAQRNNCAATKESRGMKERILFLTGRLAQSRLEKVLQGMEPTAFDWSVLSVGVKVAALMTEPILMRRLPRPSASDRVVVPPCCRADLTRLAGASGVPFQRATDELKVPPTFLGLAGAALDSTRHALQY